MVKPVAPADHATLMQSMAVSDTASQGDGAKPLGGPSPAITEAPPLPAISPKRRNWPRIILWPIAGVAALVLAFFLRPTLPPPRVTNTTQLTHDGAQKLFEGVSITIPLLTDGSRVYYTRVTSDAHTTLMQISTEGGEPVPIEIPFSPVWLSDISPNQSEMLVETLLIGNNASPLWLLRLPGGEPRRIGNLLVVDATWSPDRTAIYYSAGPDIYKTTSDGGQSQKILTTNGT